MNDFRLKVFRSVARNLSFTKAARELFVSQPAITKHVQELEAAYGVRLFERQGSRIVLTDAGQLLLEHCERILDDYRRLEFDMNLLRDRCAGELRLGASTTIAQYVLPPVLARFTHRFPQVSLSLLNGNSREVEDALLAKRIDLGLVEGIHRRQGLKYAPFLQDELVAVVSTRSRLKVPEEIAPHDLLHFPLVLREQGSGTLDVIGQALAGQGIRLPDLHVLMHLGSTESIKLFLAHADCLGIVSVRSISHELAEGRLRVVEVEGMPMRRDFCFVRLQGEEGGLAQTFERFAGRVGEEIP